METPEALFERAKAALQGGNPAAAADLARRVLATAPQAWPAHYLLATAERANKQLAAARDAFEAALGLAPDNKTLRAAYADLLLDLSLAEHAAGGAAVARATVARAVELAPDNPRAWTMLGWSRQAEGDGDAAAAALQQAIRLAPSNVTALHALAELEVERGGDAIALFDRAAALAPQDDDIALARAAARRTTGDTAGAAAAVEALADARPAWLAARRAAAQLAITDGRPEAAKAGFARATAAQPSNLELWNARLATLAKLDDHSGVLAAAEEGRVVLGEHPMLESFTAVALDELGEHDIAGPKLARLDRGEMNPALGHALVRHLLRTGRVDAAERRAALGVERAGGAGFWPYLATCWRLLGDPRSAWLEPEGVVQAIDIEEGAALAEAAAPALRRLHLDRAAPLGQTLRGGSQTTGRLFMRREPEIQRLGSALRRVVEAYAAALPPPEAGHPLLGAPRSRPQFAGSWSVRLTGGGLHVNHVHPDGWLSSAFYVSLPQMPDGSQDGWLALGQPPAELNIDLAPSAMIEPKPGRLALFPSYTWHGTRPFAAGERLTVAFDVTAS